MGSKMKMNCPYCNKAAAFVTSQQFYGRDFGCNIYWCEPCGAYTTTHGHTDRPKGTLAKRELRELRKQAHAKFDPYWKSGHMTRKEAYKWLQQIMGLNKNEAHIGMFNEDQCKKLIELLNRTS